MGGSSSFRLVVIATGDSDFLAVIIALVCDCSHGLSLVEGEIPDRLAEQRRHGVANDAELTKASRP